MDEFGSMKDDKFVDIHGREIPTITIGPHGTAVCLLSDLKQTGVTIYQKSQHAKLATIEKEFDSTFVDYMLEKAKSYMLNNKCTFTHKEIMDSIDFCTQHLNGDKPVCPKKTVFKDREIEDAGDNLVIRVANAQSTPKVTPPKPKVQKQSGIQIANAQSTPKVTPPKPKVSPLQKQSGIQNLQQLENGFDKTPIQLRPPKAKHFNETPNTTERRTVEETRSQKGFQQQETPTTSEKKSVFLKEGSQKNFKQQLEKGPQTSTKPKFNYNVSQEEHEVVVTAIDKSNCIWVRDVANNELFEIIHQKVNEEAEFQEVAGKPWVMDKVYMALDEGSWYRCKICKYSPLTVLFLDYGTVAIVKELRHVSEELANTPCMAVRITFKQPDFNPRLEDVIRIKRFMKNDDGTYFVNILKKSSNPCTPLVQYSQSLPNSSIPTSRLSSQHHEEISGPEPVILKEPQFFCDVRHEQRVVISHLKKNVFFLRTKECFSKLREIESRLHSGVKTAHNVKPQVNQVVIYENGEESKSYRALVTKFVKSKVEIDLLDYEDTILVDVSKLKAIDDELAREPRTFFKGGTLTGFENKPLEDDHKKFVKDCIEKRTKFFVDLGFDDELDLYDGSQFLSKTLENLASQVIRLSDMKTYKPEIGIKPYLCGCYKNRDNLAIVPSAELTQHIENIMKYELDDKEPYDPITGEVCMCYYFDHWYRCVVTRKFDKECEVLLLDFGNIELIKHKDFRKAMPNITEIPVLALPCVLTGAPEHPDADDLLQKLIIDGEVYNIDIKKIDGGKFHVEIPTVYKKIQDLL